MKSPIIVSHTVGGLNFNSGGTTRVVIDLTNSLASIGSIRVNLLSQRNNALEVPLSASSSVSQYVADSNSRFELQLGLPFRKLLNRLPNRGSTCIVHNHGIWLASNHWAVRYAVTNQIPLVLQPHGMLEPWALDYRSWKKQLAMFLYQRRDLNSARVLVATSIAEYKNLRTLGFRQPIAVIPNGVRLDAVYKFDQPPIKHPERTRHVLFLSRIHEKKGIMDLIRAWSLIRPSGWCLQIAGPDENGYLTNVMSLVERERLTNSVEYVGVVDGEDKDRLYNCADLFVLPTFSENFGLVVAEALAHAVPVITTRGAPWVDLINFKCGWWIDIGVEPLVSALVDAMSLSDAERLAMGERGRTYVKRYDWDIIAQQNLDLYNWVLGKACQPEYVYSD